MSTKIGWCHYTTLDGKLIRGATLNPIKGCSHAAYQPADGGQKVAHPGCENCYAQTFCGRNLHGEKESGVAKWDGTIEFFPARLSWPFIKHGFTARKDGHKRIVFLCSESDMGHPNVPDEAWKAINGMMIVAKHIIHKDLTKRPEIQRARLERWSPAECVQAWARMAFPILPRVTIAHLISEVGGLSTSIQWSDIPYIHRYASVSDQSTADALVPQLLRVPAAVRGVSLEPMVGAADLSEWMSPPERSGTSYGGWSEMIGGDSLIDHVIVGGESGRKARPCNVEWIRSVIEQCRAASVPCFVKQIGSNPTLSEYFDWPASDPKGGDPSEWPADLRVRMHVGEGW